jgi:sugar phosphate isomerase/epimerase
MAGTIKHGVTLYSFSNEYAGMTMDFEQILDEVKRMGYEGVEFIPSQMAPEYPYLSDGFLEYLKKTLADHGLQPVCWSAYIDMGIRSDRDLTEQEIIQYTLNDLIYAKKAGFPIVRTQHAISPKIFRAMIPYCRDLGVKLTIEMHHPHHPSLPVWQEYFSIMRGEGKGLLGFVPDMSIFQDMPHKLWIDEAVGCGCRRAVIDEMIDKHRRHLPQAEVLKGDYTEIEKKYGAQMESEYDGCATLEELLPYLDCAFYMHGKFYYLGEDLKDTCIPYNKILPAIRDSGYTGYIACEYEGHHFDPSLSTSEQLERYVRMSRRLLGQAE